MRDKINKDYLIVLKKVNTEISIEYFKIEGDLDTEFDKLKSLCSKNYETLDELISTFKNNERIRAIDTYYNYCRDISRPYQGYIFGIDSTLKKLISVKDFTSSLENKIWEKARQDEIFQIKNQCLSDILEWEKVYNIERTYTKCQNNPQIITFSHRKSGWTLPYYKLTENFSFQLRTNFGFGSVSYFYMLLKFKEIEIATFSDWVIYEYADLYELIKYSKKYCLINESWQEALEYTRDACLISLRDEEEFIEKYVISECEQMVNGLEGFLQSNAFNLKGLDSQMRNIEKNGEHLTLFRAEKICGALSFISKIIEYKKLKEVDNFIGRIEMCNKKIQPILKKEVEIILPQKIGEAEMELAKVKPGYDKAVTVNSDYINKIEEFKKTLEPKLYLYPFLIQKYIEIDPAYDIFLKSYNKIKAEYDSIDSKIRELKNFKTKFSEYSDKIAKHFEMYPPVSKS